MNNNQQLQSAAQQETGKNKQTWRSFGLGFYLANTMEIFERLAWYGFFAVSSVYMTTPIEQGGVGFSDAERGAVQGIIPFFLYLLPHDFYTKQILSVFVKNASMKIWLLSTRQSQTKG